MRLEQMEYLVAIAKEGSMTKAAAKLYVSQPALSKQIDMLEKELECLLLVRAARGVSLTREGEYLAREYRHILEEIHNANGIVKNMSRMEETSFTIGCFEGDAVKELLRTFNEHLLSLKPQAEIVVRRDTLANNRTELREGRLDLFLNQGFNEKLKEEFAHCKISERQGSIYYAGDLFDQENKPAAYSEFSGKPFLLTEMAVENGLVEHCNKICKSLGIQDSKPLVVKNFITLLTYLQMGRGYCFLTEGGARQFGAVEEMPLPQNLSTMEVYAFWRKDDRRMSKLMKTF